MLPEKIAHYLYDILNFPSEVAYIQVATHSRKGPTMRTMKLTQVTELGELILFSNTQTKKWNNIVENSRIEVLLYDKAKNIQLKANGIAQLNADPNDVEIINCWIKVRTDVKEAICQGKPESNNVPPRYFGKIKMIPQYWEVLKIDNDFYPHSLRYEYVLTNDIWVENRLKVIS